MRPQRPVADSEGRRLWKSTKRPWRRLGRGDWEIGVSWIFGLSPVYYLLWIHLWCSFHSCFILLPPPKEVWGKVIFSEACVKNSVHGGVPARGGVPAPGGAWWRAPGRLLLRAVRILLECTLVYFYFRNILNCDIRPPFHSDSVEPRHVWRRKQTTNSHSRRYSSQCGALKTFWQQNNRNHSQCLFWIWATDSARSFFESDLHHWSRCL